MAQGGHHPSARAERWPALLAAFVMISFVTALAAGPAAATSCWEGSGEPLASGFSGLSPEGDVRLPGAARGRLIGVKIEPPDGASNDLQALLKAWEGQALRGISQPGPDRWSRLPVVVGDADRGDDLGLAPVQHGFAMVWPPELPLNCRIRYLQAEQQARHARRGRWAVAELGLHDAGDGVRVALKAGEVIVMQGKVMHVGQTRTTTYLNFGQRQVGASAESGMPVWRALERQGWTTQTLRGQNVSVRGVASLGRPARVLVDDVSSIEFAE